MPKVSLARGGSLSGVMPIIQVRQHVVEPSPILSTLADTEIRKHTDWAVRWLRALHQERRSRPEQAELAPSSVGAMRKAAVAANRLAAAVELETILERAEREGKVWLTRRDRYAPENREVWIRPNADDLTALKTWVDQYLIIQLGVASASTASGVEELLFAADVSWLADRLAERLAFPRAMFADGIWPVIVAHLLETRTIGVRRIGDNIDNAYGAKLILTLFQGHDVAEAAGALTAEIKPSDCSSIGTYLTQSVWTLRRSHIALSWPSVLMNRVSPVWLKEHVLPPSGLMRATGSGILSAAPLPDAERDAIVEWMDRNVYGSNYRMTDLDEALVPAAFPGLLLAGFDIVRRPSADRAR
ncbi:hypothetical protein [Cupriavidus necator]|uniref:hypothetical protein n=1 Tax=Cupriavidus necator TaxID=106590 RepID=UPI00339D63BD